MITFVPPPPGTGEGVVGTTTGGIVVVPDVGWGDGASDVGGAREFIVVGGEVLVTGRWLKTQDCPFHVQCSFCLHSPKFLNWLQAGSSTSSSSSVMSLRPPTVVVVVVVAAVVVVALVIIVAAVVVVVAAVVDILSSITEVDVVVFVVNGATVVEATAVLLVIAACVVVALGKTFAAAAKLIQHSDITMTDSTLLL